MMRSRLSNWGRDHKYAVNNGSQVSQRIKIKYRRMATNVLPFHSKEVWTERLLHQSSYLFWLLFALMLICIWKFFFFAATSDAAADKESQPTITIFAAPKLFSNSSSDGRSRSILGVRQELAVRSWLTLSPHVTVVLFGQHPSIEAFAEFVGPRVSVESNIDFTFLGTPFFHSMVARAQASSSDISVLVDPETVILPDLITTLNHANKLVNDWFLVSVSTSVSQFPSQRSVNFKKLGEFLNRNRNPNTCGERLLLAWNTGQAPLYAGVFPPFLHGKGIHNRWLVNEVLLSDLRLVIDASETISSFYPEAIHDPPNHFSTDFGEKSASEDVWENNCNTHIAYFYGSLYFQQYMDSKNFARIIKCMGRNIFINKSENSAYEVAGTSRRMYFQSQMSKWRACVERQSKCSAVNLPDVALELPAPISLPFSLTQLLEMVADENNSVALAVAGDSYRDMLMSWVCRLRRLAVTNFLVIALDAETYQFAVLQGLPVVMDQLAPRNISFNNCHFGSECFQRVTKVKSRLVLQILKLGYNVLLSDVDVYWFHNPLPYLHSFGPAVLVAQSDEYNETGPINVPRRLNSGFYYARSDATTIVALEMVVKHASVSGLSEQPSFYDMLCGECGTNRMGSDRCVEPKTNLTVHFLDRDLFPNGAYQGLWEKSDVESACREKGSYILHNNWISGRQRKLERQIKSGLWAYNVSTRMCLR